MATSRRRTWRGPTRNGPDVPTPVTDGTYFYVINDSGIVWCLDAKTGEEIYGRQRIRRSTYSASPVLADGKIYITNEDGLTTVLKAGPEFEVLAEKSAGRLLPQLAGDFRRSDLYQDDRVSVRDRGANASAEPLAPRIHAGGLKYSTIPAPSAVTTNPTYRSGLGAIRGGCSSIDTSTLTSGAPPKTKGIT